MVRVEVPEVFWFAPPALHIPGEILTLAASKQKRAVALVSGGLDSVVSLARALELADVRLVLFINYGQRAVDRERDAVMAVVNFYALPFAETDLSWLGGLSPGSMRYRGAGAGREGAPPPESLDAVWIPNRNGVFINVAAAYAESYQCNTVVTGFNREEAAEFPDNREEYVARINKALELSTRTAVEVVSFTQNLNKVEILELGIRLRTPLSVIWSCYHGGELMCGSCMSCRKLKAAIQSVTEASRPLIEFAG
jgi:7-cyano-7-deazaguanine synthase